MTFGIVLGIIYLVLAGLALGINFVYKKHWTHSIWIFNSMIYCTLYLMVLVK